MADLVHKSLTSGIDPQLSHHLATKNYVDMNRRGSEINTRSGNYTLVLSDQSKVVEVDSTATTTVTVPANATVPFPVGTIIRVRKMNTGNVSVAGASGVVINWVGSFTVSARYSSAELHKRASDQWIGMLIGT